MAEIVMIGSAILGAFGAARSHSQQRKAVRAQRQQAEVQRNRDMMQTLRQRQIMAAQMSSTAAGAGVMGSSGFQQAQGSLGGQAYEGIGFGNTMTEMGQRVQNYSQRAQTWAGVSQLGFQGLGFALGGGVDKVGSVFGSRGQQQQQ